MGRSTHRLNSLVLLWKISSGKSFNWLLCKFLPTYNHNQSQLHGKREIKDCVLGVSRTTVKKTITIKNKNGKTKLFYRIRSMLFLVLRETRWNSARRQLTELGRKIGIDTCPVYTSCKIGHEIKPKEKKPPIINQQRVVYFYKCSLCDANDVRYTCRHLYQRVEEHKGSSSIGNHIKEQHGTVPSDIYRGFTILRKCQSKFDCLIYEMLFIKELKPILNKQSDSIRAKLFI